MIVVDVYLKNGKLYRRIYAKYFGQYTNVKSGYEYYVGSGDSTPIHYEPDFVKTLMRDLAMENAKFVHDGKEVSLEEAYKILHLDKV
jgi:hypothetical protein